MSDTIAVTQTKTATAEFRDQNNNIIVPTTPIAWAVNPANALVLGSGTGLSIQVAGQTACTCTLTATEPTSGVVGSDTITVTPIEALITQATVKLS